MSDRVAVKIENHVAEVTLNRAEKHNAVDFAMFEALTEAVTLEPPSGELEVEVNNTARLWISLPPSKVLQAGIARSTLLKLRRW